MGPRASGRDPDGWRVRSANDLFKAGWNARLSWSTVVAVAAHSVAFLWSPIWERPDPPSEVPFERTVMEGVSLADGPSDAGGALSAQIAVIEEEAEPTPEEADPDEGSGVSEGDRDGVVDVLRERLRSRAAPVPRIVESVPEPEPEPDQDLLAEESSSGSGSDEESNRIDAVSSILDYESRPEGAVDMDRLSAIRPQLAFLSPSAWILIQNPTEVVDFLENRFRGGRLDSGSAGSVSVALWIDERGSVEWAEINRSSGHPDLDQSALQLFNEVVSFRPAREQGVRVPMAVIFSVPYPW